MRNPTTYFTIAAKIIVAAEVHKDMPLTTVMSQIAVTLKMNNKLGFRLGAVILNLMKQAGIFKEYIKHTENGHNERVIILAKKWAINDEMFKELSLKVGKCAKPMMPKMWTPDHKGGYLNTKWVSGSRLNEVIKQSQDMYDVLNHLQQVAYAVDWDVFNKFKDDFQDSFPSDQSMIEINKMQAELEIIGDQKAYFAYNFGTNGRVYCEGYRTHRHAGIRNEVFDFHKKSIWNQDDIYIVERQIKDLKGDISAKGKIQHYKLTRDLAAQMKGIATGTIIKRDAKMSGVQQIGAIMMRSNTDAKYVGLLKDFPIDGRLKLTANGVMAKYKMDKPQAKAAAMTWMYLSGGDAMVNKVKNDTGRDLDVDGKLFKREWDEAGEFVFPGQIKFMGEVMSIIKYFKNNTHYRFTSSSGFKVSIAAIGTVIESIDTVMGRHEFSREEIDAEFMGVKLGAAAGHSEDASSLHLQVLAAKAACIDIDTVHDQFGHHLADSETGDTTYSNNMKWKLKQPLLERFLHETANNGGRAKHILINNLKEQDIVAGLFD